MGVGIHRALLRSAKYLQTTQLDDGGFESQSKSHYSSDVLIYRTTFIPSQILSCIAEIDVPALAAVKRKLADFIWAQKNEHWSYNYWARNSSEFSDLPYPDDLDDTFCALIALTKSNPKMFDGKALGAITQLLVATEANAGGPYRTWLVGSQTDKAWRDIDVAVNANIGYFLSLHDVTLPNIESLIETAIQQNQVSSPYYPNTFPIAYFISRWYRGELLSKLVHGIYRRKHDTSLKAAFKLAVLMHSQNTSLDPEPLVEYILSTQAADGSWPADEFCIDPTIDGKTYYATSSSLTTAFCMEALYLYGHATERAQTATQPKRVHDRLYDKVVRNVTRDIRTLQSPELRANTMTMLQEMLARDNDRQIILLPYVTEKVFGGGVDQEILSRLAAVSLWGWMAYTIYDDFLDGEGRPDRLPTANVALRQVTTTLLATMPDNHAFQTEITDILNKLDGANAWEITHCRGMIKQGKLYVTGLPDYGNYWQLAERSLGHTISAIGVLYAAQYQAKDIRTLKRFLHHYLIARQLNDDAHDWLEDLSQTHVNAVGVRVLRVWQETGGSFQRGIDLKKDAENLSLIMWEQVIQEVVRDIDKHIASARRALVKFPAGSHIELFDRLLVPLERSAHQALDERDNALEFIDTLDTN